MTKAFLFIVDGITRMYEFGKSLSFEFMGYKLSMFEILVGFSILGIIFRFFFFFVPGMSDETIGRLSIGRKENRADKIQQRRELSAIRKGGKHVKYTGPRHTKSYISARPYEERNYQGESK